MRARIQSLPVVVLTLAASMAWSADRMVRLVPANGSTLFVKEFAVAAGTTITGVTFVTNDERTTFPEVSLVRGPATSLASATTLRTTADFRPGSTAAALTWSQPVTVTEAGTYYVAIRFPAGPGGGPALAANDAVAPSGSYAAGSREDAMIPAKLDLAIQLTTSPAGPSKAAPAGDHPQPEPEPRAGETTLDVRVGGAASPVTIALGLRRPSMVALGVYDVAGRLVRQVHRGAMQAGTHERTWDGRDERGTEVAGGVYLVRLGTDDTSLTRKVILSR